jgi:predicted phosphate transport protein (TIGR00153 family)
MFKLTHKEEDYYAMFGDIAVLAVEAAQRLDLLARDYRDVPGAIRDIEKIEHAADERVHAVNDQLNRSFITPIDREDIFLVAKKLDRIIDVIDSTSQRFVMYNVTVVAEDAKALIAHIVTTAVAVKDLVSQLRAHKQDKFSAAAKLVDSLEHDGDVLYRAAMHRLFSEQKDAIEVLKWKEIYQILEKAIDACEEAANVIHGVVVKNS